MGALDQVRPAWRARSHPGYVAFLVHRVSGVALAIFLPLHFLALGLAISGEASLDGFLRWTDRPMVKVAETVLVGLLAVHLGGGVRVLAIEFLRWRAAQSQWVAWVLGLGLAVGGLHLLRVFG